MTFIVTLTADSPRNQVTISTLTNRVWHLGSSSSVTHGLVILLRGCLFRVSASSRHCILLMLTGRSQSEAKTPITISINSIPPSAGSSSRRTRDTKQHTSPSWSVPPAKRKRDSSVCTYSYKVEWLTVNLQARKTSVWKESAPEMLISHFLFLFLCFWKCVLRFAN